MKPKRSVDTLYLNSGNIRIAPTPSEMYRKEHVSRKLTDATIENMLSLIDANDTAKDVEKKTGLSLPSSYRLLKEKKQREGKK